MYLDSKLSCRVLRLTSNLLEITISLLKKQWNLNNDFWGAWYLIEVIGFVLIPCFMYAYGHRNRNIFIIRIAAILTLIGILLNRLNVSVIAFKWYEPVHYFPSWQEFVVTLMVVFSEIWVFRWIVYRMPVYKSTH